MPKRRILLDTYDLEESLKRFEEICNQKPVDKEAADAFYRKLNQRLGELRSLLFVLLDKTRTKEQPARSKKTPTLKEKPTSIPVERVSYSWTPGPNYETPTTPLELKELLKKTFGASNKSLEFSDHLLEQAMAQAHLEYRGDWAVYCTLLAIPEMALDESDLERATEYNTGAVSSTLHRLLQKNLVHKTDGNRYVISTTAPDSPTFL